MLDLPVIFVSFHIYSAEGTCRTEVLACAAANAFLCVYCRNLHPIVGLHHRNCSGRAVAGTVAAFNPVCERNAVCFHPDGVAYLDGGFFRCVDRSYCSCWTYV